MSRSGIVSAEELGGQCPLSTTPAGGISLGSLGCLRLAYGPEKVMDEIEMQRNRCVASLGFTKERTKKGRGTPRPFLLDITGINDILEIKYIT